jgi:CheY-like chemotaxis protein
VYTQRTSQGIRIVVGDTGPGIAKDQLERIFDEFHQIRSPSAGEREGFGLGLSIVKRLVRVLGLDLDVQSTLGRGTAFSILAPLGSHSATPVLVAPAAAVAKGTKGRILLVDDESEVRQATAFFLELEGHEVVSVGSLAEAIDAVSTLELALDVIVTDFQLGTVADGADLIYRVRAIRGQDVPAVVLSGDMLGAMRKCASIPRCKIFNKPVDPEALAVQLDTAMAEARAA